MLLNEYLSWRAPPVRAPDTADAATLEPASVASDHAQQYIACEALLAELGKLSRRQRAVLVLRYYEDRGDAEIAELLGCSPGTVRSHASRALDASRVYRYTAHLATW